MTKTKHLRSLFVEYLTEDSKTQNINHEDFNHAVFKEDGWIRFGDIHVDMILHKFDMSVKKLKRLKNMKKKMR